MPDVVGLSQQVVMLSAFGDVGGSGIQGACVIVVLLWLVMLLVQGRGCICHCVVVDGHCIVDSSSFVTTN